MKQIESIIDRLEEVCGLRAELVDMPQDMPTGGIYSDAKSDKTVFTVAHGGKNYAFAIDGCGNQQRITAALAREFMSAALSRVKSADEPLRAFLVGIGEPPIGVRVGKTDYYVFAVYCAAMGKSVREYLTAIAGTGDFVADMTEGITAFCKRIDNENDYQSAGEFALVLRENLAEEIKENVKIGVGGVAHGVSELPQYYAFAQSALMSGAEFDPQNDIYSYKEYALIRVLSELPSVTMEKYVKTALDKNYRVVLSDDELMTAADAFIKRSLNISEASRSMYVHRNTLIYRLDKIEKMTGLNIRNFSDAMTFRVAYLIYKML